MKHFIIALGVGMTFLFAACTSCKQKQPSGETAPDELVEDSVSAICSYESFVRAEARALVDTTYVSTDEYREICSRYEAVIDGWLGGKSEAESLQCQLDIAKQALERNGRYFATHTDEMHDPLNQKLMMTYSKKVRELQMRIITVKKQ